MAYGVQIFNKEGLEMISNVNPFNAIARADFQLPKAGDVYKIPVDLNKFPSYRPASMVAVCGSLHPEPDFLFGNPELPPDANVWDYFVLLQSVQFNPSEIVVTFTGQVNVNPFNTPIVPYWSISFCNKR